MHMCLEGESGRCCHAGPWSSGPRVWSRFCTCGTNPKRISSKKRRSTMSVGVWIQSFTLSYAALRSCAPSSPRATSRPATPRQ